MVTSPFVLSFTCCANLCASTARKSPSPSLAPGHWCDRRNVTAPSPPPLSASPQAVSKPTSKTVPITDRNRPLSVTIFPLLASAAVIEIPEATRTCLSLCQAHRHTGSPAESLTCTLLPFCPSLQTVVDRPSNVTNIARISGQGRQGGTLGA